MIAAILLAHLVGDYLIQSHWMAVEKTSRWWPAVAHGVTYALPFLFITTDWRALLVIAGTHIVIDRYRLARYLIWASNWLAPVRVYRGETSLVAVDSYNPPWRECTLTGYPPYAPAWLAGWLLVIADNTVHILLNVAAVKWLG